MKTKHGWLLLLLGLALPAAAADYAREKKWADEIGPGIVVGDAVNLALPGGRNFLGIYTPAANARAAVILVHGIGVHPDWGLIGGLRAALPERGYATLSVQMPVLAPDAKAEDYLPEFPEAAQRIAAAVAWLKAKGHARIAIVSHSLGARMSEAYLSGSPDAAVAAWVAVGLPAAFAAPKALKVPTLDLHGDHDLPPVLKNTGERAFYLRRIPGSAQIVVAGADHFFNGKEAELLKFTAAFLDKALKPR